MEESQPRAEPPAEPPADLDPSKVITIKLRLPDGQGLQRRFLRTNTFGDIMKFIRKES